MKKIAVLIIVCFISFWSMRIHSINKADVSGEIYLESGDETEAGGVSYTLTKSRMYTVEEFEQMYGADELIVPEGNMLLCACISVKNETSEDMSWDYIMDLTTGGFEMLTWGSTPISSIGRYMNTFEENALEPGKTQEVWYVTGLIKQSFKEKTWNDIRSCEFYYIPQYTPEKIMYRLDME